MKRAVIVILALAVVGYGQKLTKEEKRKAEQEPASVVIAATTDTIKAELNTSTTCRWL
jgi:hypothetical protein